MGVTTGVFARCLEHSVWQWLPAEISARKGLLTIGILGQRQKAWDIAARHTPHGQPIELK
jgi:hypothetical protein